MNSKMENLYQIVTLLVVFVMHGSQALWTPTNDVNEEGWEGRIRAVELKLSQLQSVQEMSDVRIQSMTQSLIKEMSTLHNRSKMADAMIQALVADSVKLSDRADGAETNVSILGSKLGNMRQDLTNRVQTVVDSTKKLQMEVVSLEQNSSTLRQIVHQHTNQISAMSRQSQNQNQTLQSKIEQLDKSLKALSEKPGSSSIANEDVKALKNQMDKLESRLGTVEETVPGQINNLYNSLKDMQRTQKEDRMYQWSK